MTGQNAPSIKLSKPAGVQDIILFLYAQFKIWVISYVSI